MISGCWPAKAARRDFAIYRAETHTGKADMRIQHGYTVPADEEAPAEADTEALALAA